MTTINELAAQTAALLNATRKGETWLLIPSDYNRATVVANDALKVRVAFRPSGAGDRVTVIVKLTGDLAEVQPTYSTRSGAHKGWKPIGLKLSRGIEALSLKVLSYVTTTAIAGLAAATARRDEAATAAARAAQRVAERNTLDNAAIRSVYAEAPGETNSSMHRRWYADPIPGRINASYNLGNGTRANVVIKLNGRNDRAEMSGPISEPTFEMEIDRLTPEMARAILTLLRGDEPAVGMGYAMAMTLGRDNY